MQYYNRSTNQTVQSLPDYATAETCRDYGWWPIYDAPFTEDLRYWTRIPGNVEFNADSQTFTQRWIPLPLPLDSIKSSKQEDFDKTFQHLEAKQARPVSTLTIRMAEGTTTFPEDDFDAGLLWSLEQIKDENRLLLQSIKDMQVTEEMTAEEADAVCLAAIAVVPWLPDGSTLKL